MGNASHGWSGCSATSPSPSNDGKEKSLSTQLYPVLPLLDNTAPSLIFFVRCLAQDVVKMAKLQEEATAVIVRAHAAQGEGMSWEKTVLLATTHGEAVEAT
jgi:hypothetical protein